MNGILLPLVFIKNTFGAGFSFIKLIFGFIFNTIGTIIFKIRLHSAIIWLFFSRLRFLGFSKETQTYHKILVLGDGFAFGFGDYVTLLTNAGISRHLEDFIQKSGRLRQKWEVVNCGHYRATSSDWLPEGNTMPRHYSWFSGKSLFQKVFQNSQLNDSSFALLFVGSEDTCTPEETVKNIQQIGANINERGITLGVALTFAKLDTLPERKKQITRNRLLLDWIKSENENGNNKLIMCFNPKEIAVYPDTDGFDDYHYSSKGYLHLCAKLLPKMINAFVAKEWVYFKQVLGPQMAPILREKCGGEVDCAVEHEDEKGDSSSEAAAPTQVVGSEIYTLPTLEEEEEKPVRRRAGRAKREK